MGAKESSAETGTPLEHLPVLQSHGTGDFSIGVNGGRWLHSFFVDNLRMRRAEYIEFNGGHTIPEDVADKLVDLIAEITATSSSSLEDLAMESGRSERGEEGCRAAAAS